MLYIILKYTIGPLLWLLWRPMIIGKENLAVKGKAVFASNHTSMLDPVLLAIISFRNIHFMAKKELFSNKLIALLLRSLLSFPVDRKNADLQSLKRAMKVWTKEKSLEYFQRANAQSRDGWIALKGDGVSCSALTSANNTNIYSSGQLQIGKAQDGGGNSH